MVGLIFAEPIYIYLFTNHLTKTEPLSLFDVIQISGIIGVLFMANLAYNKVEELEKKFMDLHKELSIILSENNLRKK